MSKDPAILFYTQDFLTGCTDLTFEERGQYITLLCLQHQRGHLSEKTIRLSIGSASVDVLKKFLKDNNGNYYNERMEVEIQKRLQFIQTRIDNGLKGGRPKKANDKPNAKANGLANENLIENVNVNVIDTVNEYKKEVLKISEFVSMTNDEYEKLIKEHGESNTKILIEILNNYKGSTGKKYKSDYLAILNWVIDKAKKENKYIGKQLKPPLAI